MTNEETLRDVAETFHKRLGAYLNTMVADLDIQGKGQYLRNLFGRFEKEVAELLAATAPKPDVQRCTHGKSHEEHCEQCVGLWHSLTGSYPRPQSPPLCKCGHNESDHDNGPVMRFCAQCSCTHFEVGSTAPKPEPPSTDSMSIKTPRKIQWFCQFCNLEHIAFCPNVDESKFLRDYSELSEVNDTVKLNEYTAPGQASDAAREPKNGDRDA